MTVIRWSPAGRSWEPVEGEAMPEDLGGAEVGLYEVLLTSASGYALGLHADRIARSWELLTGRPLAAEGLPSLAEARAEARRRQWPALRFDVLRFKGERAIAEIRRREPPSLKPPLALLPVECDASDAAYPHKSADRTRLARAYRAAVAAGAH